MKIETRTPSSSEEIDWSKDSQLVVSKRGGKLTHQVVFVVNEKPAEENCFCGVDLLSGIYSDKRIKTFFEPFVGEITLENN